MLLPQFISSVNIFVNAQRVNCDSKMIHIQIMFLLQFIQFTLLLRNILPEISVLDGQQLVQSLETLTKNCDQSRNYVRILDAVHHSLGLPYRFNKLYKCSHTSVFKDFMQKQLKELEQQLSMPPKIVILQFNKKISEHSALLIALDFS